jgi:L-threonylcarbamoyladenylate synthase
VLADLGGRVDLILDGGPTQVGVESTIIACLDHAVLLRPGGLPREAIERALGQALLAGPSCPTDENKPLAPGMLAAHYAPRAVLRLNVSSVEKGEALLAFGPALNMPARDTAVLNLSPHGNLIEAAANLFSHLRALDATGAKTIAVMSIPHEGLGEAINDRLTRAAAPRR